MLIQFGFHASSGGNIEKLPLSVKELGGECFQFFSRNPYGGKVLPLDKEIVDGFKKNCHRSGIANYYIHAPYFINLASLNNRIFYGSVKAIRDDLSRAETLGARFVVTHIGSAKDFREKGTLLHNPVNPSLNYLNRQNDLNTMSQEKGFSSQAFGRVVDGLRKITEGSKKVLLLLEIAAGAGAILGVKLEEIAFYLESVPALSGFCFDTAHAFASGYDLRKSKDLVNTFSRIESVLSKDKIKLVHINDSKGDLGSRIDRHAHIGEGYLGRETFLNLVDYFKKKNYNIDMILETPTQEGLKNDLALLKQYRSG